MFIGDEREIVHLNADWSIVLTALLWVWFSLTVTVFAVREQYRRARQERQGSEGNLEQEGKERDREEGLARRKNQKDSRNGKQHAEA